MTPEALKTLVRKTQARFNAIDNADYDAANHRYRTASVIVKWRQAAREVAPAEWAEIVRVLAQGESYYGGEY